MASIRVQHWIGSILLYGTILSTLIVMVGGAQFLLQNGGQSLQSELLQTKTAQVSITEVWRFAISFTPLGTVQLGLLLLIATQILRVFLLCLYYVATKDYAFTLISFFILAVLIYSSCWRH